MKTLRLISLCLLLPPAVAHAQEGAIPGRFALERLESGVVRLDSLTGAMSFCHEKDGDLVCRMAADERAAYEQQLDRLEKRVDALEAKSGVSGGVASGGDALPSDEEVDRSIGIMERFMRSFFGMVQEFEDKKNKTTP